MRALPGGIDIFRDKLLGQIRIVSEKSRVFKNVVAQFIGRCCLIYQATTEILEVKTLETG